MDIAELRQDLEEAILQANATAKLPPAPTPQPKKVVQPPPPKPVAKTVKAVREIPKPKPIPKPGPKPELTSAEKIQRLQSIADSVVMGGRMGSSIITADSSQSPPLSTSSDAQLVSNKLTASSSAQLVSYKKPKVNDALEAPLLLEKVNHTFRSGTFVEGDLSHPVFFQDNVGIANFEITESNTPLPVGTELTIRLQNIRGVIRIVSVQALYNGQTVELERDKFHIAQSDGLPLVPSSLSGVKGTNAQGELDRNRAARNIIRNTSNIYDGDDPLVSLLLGTGATIADGQLATRGSRLSNSAVNNPQIALIRENTSVRLYVIQPFNQILF